MDDLILPKGRFIPVISEFRDTYCLLGSYATRDGIPIQRMSEPGSTLPLMHLERHQSAFFNRHTSTVTPNELCMKYYNFVQHIYRPYIYIYIRNLCL